MGLADGGAWCQLIIGGRRAPCGGRACRDGGGRAHGLAVADGDGDRVISLRRVTERHLHVIRLEGGARRSALQLQTDASQSLKWDSDSDPDELLLFIPNIYPICNTRFRQKCVSYGLANDEPDP